MNLKHCLSSSRIQTQNIKTFKQLHTERLTQIYKLRGKTELCNINKINQKINYSNDPINQNMNKQLI